MVLSDLSPKDLSCPICLEDFNLLEDDRMPKLLLCIHTICFTCLQNLLHNGCIQCPICRYLHVITEGLENLLDNNAVVVHLREILRLKDDKTPFRLFARDCFRNFLAENMDLYDFRNEAEIVFIREIKDDIVDSQEANQRLDEELELSKGNPIRQSQLQEQIANYEHPIQCRVVNYLPWGRHVNESTYSPCMKGAIGAYLREIILPENNSEKQSTMTVRRGNDEGSELLVANDEGSELLVANDEGPELLVVNDEGSELLVANDEGSELLVVNDEGSELLVVNDEGSELLVANDEGSELLVANDEGSELLVSNDEGSELLVANDEGSTIRKGRKFLFELESTKGFLEEEMKSIAKLFLCQQFGHVESMKRYFYESYDTIFLIVTFEEEICYDVRQEQKLYSASYLLRGYICTGKKKEIGIKNISIRVTESDLRSYFSKFGTILSLSQSSVVEKETGLECDWLLNYEEEVAPIVVSCFSHKINEFEIDVDISDD